MKITYARIKKAVLANKECKDGFYAISAPRGSLSGAICRAVNQGIDGHLEACFIPAQGDRFEWVGGRLECKVSAKSLPVLLRRLQQMDDLGKLDEDDETIVSDILGTLGIECEAGCVEIVNEKTRKGMSLARLIKIATGAYPVTHCSVLPMTGQSYDPLAKFIAAKIEATYDPDASRTEQLEEAHKAIHNATRELEKARKAFSDRLLRAPWANEGPDT